MILRTNHQLHDKLLARLWITAVASVGVERRSWKQNENMLLHRTWL
jgi:hypothetical protein